MNNIISNSLTISLETFPKVSKEPPIFEKIRRVYFNAICALVDFLIEHDWFMTGATLGTLLTEPWQSLKAGILYPLGDKKYFNFYGLNPAVLTKEQRLQSPILLVHGNIHNQSAWLSLAKELKVLNRAVYTINLPAGKITKKDHDLVNQKIAEIQLQFLNPDLKIDLIGHSRGALMAFEAAWIKRNEKNELFWNRSTTIGKTIFLGTPLSTEWTDLITRDHGDQLESYLDTVHEVTGSRDVLMRDQPLPEIKNQLRLSIGHAELLYSDAVHAQIIDWLQA